jgi:hypothetical protein
MRAYHLNNFYMASIQQGIQAAHAQTKLFLKYCNVQSASEHGHRTLIWKWAEDPTMYCLNGGDDKQMHENLEYLSNICKTYPFACFTESESAMGGMLTNIVLIVPPKIYEARRALVNKTYRAFDNNGSKYSYRPNSLEDFIEVLNEGNPRTINPVRELMQKELDEFLHVRRENEFTLEDARLGDFCAGFRLAI